MEGHNSGWQDQVWKYEVLIPMHDHHFDGTKRTMLKKSVHEISNVCARDEKTPIFLGAGLGFWVL